MVSSGQVLWYQVHINQSVCEQGKVFVLIKSHGNSFFQKVRTFTFLKGIFLLLLGEATGNCIPSDRKENAYVCEISSWCPVEIDRLPLDKENGPLIPGAYNYTVFIKNSISFTRFGENYHRTNMPHGICIYKPDKPGMYVQ